MAHGPEAQGAQSLARAVRAPGGLGLENLPFDLETLERRRGTVLGDPAHEVDRDLLRAADGGDRLRSRDLPGGVDPDRILVREDEVFDQVRDPSGSERLVRPADAEQQRDYERRSRVRSVDGKTVEF